MSSTMSACFGCGTLEPAQPLQVGCRSLETLECGPFQCGSYRCTIDLFQRSGDLWILLEQRLDIFVELAHTSSLARHEKRRVGAPLFDRRERRLAISEVAPTERHGLLPLDEHVLHSSNIGRKSRSSPF